MKPAVPPTSAGRRGGPPATNQSSITNLRDEGIPGVSRLSPVRLAAARGAELGAAAGHWLNLPAGWSAQVWADEPHRHEPERFQRDRRRAAFPIPRRAPSNTAS